MKKLKHTTKESFLIKRNIKNVVYELRILKIKIFKIFNVNSLTITNLIILIAKKLKIKHRKKKYEVNKILNKRKIKNRIKFFIN